MVRKQFKDVKFDLLESFLGWKVTDLIIKTTNNTEVDIGGIVAFNFWISDLNGSFKVPFIVTKHRLSAPVIGFNILEYLVKTPRLLTSWTQIWIVFPHLNSIKTEVLVNWVQEKSSWSDFDGIVWNFENFIILAD